jgi:hypothetical protein
MFLVVCENISFLIFLSFSLFLHSLAIEVGIITQFVRKTGFVYSRKNRKTKK